ncbi:MAG: VWA domain-containing protein [Pyrinomonadaceae bacterium]|nr:VWA domain-containing protein [Pyrinomonadaceae bacterium]
MKKYLLKTIAAVVLFLGGTLPIQAQKFERDFPFGAGGTIEVKNLYGRVYFQSVDDLEDTVKISADATMPISENDIKIEASGGKIKIKVVEQSSKNRVDFSITIPERTRVFAETDEGEIRFMGNFLEARGETNTGTIYADLPLENLHYDFEWTASRPRFISEVDLEEVKEKSAGRFVLKGKINEAPKIRIDPVIDISDGPAEEVSSKQKKIAEKNRLKGSLVKLKLSTARGIILLNVSPEEVPSNLRARPLTRAAKAIIRSGDSLLTNAIRRATPKYFGEYAATLPPRMATPTLGTAARRNNSSVSGIKRVTVQVTDINNRAMAGLLKDDFELSERGADREVISVEPTTAPFNLVLLLDVSGSIEHYVDFIRKAARNFLNTTSPQDRIAIVTFNEDVTPLSGLTRNRVRLSESLDTFDAGGGTAYYDALAYSLTDTLKSLQSERTAIVVLSDGDDNRSFLPFNSLLGSIQESGALIYPLYVPSGLIASSATNDPKRSIDPLRSRYIALTSKAQSEGETLAKVSGGVYYPIARLSELQEAYDDIVKQLRTAYSITYRSNPSVTNDRTSPRLKVKVKRKTAFVKIGPIVNIGSK